MKRFGHRRQKADIRTISLCPCSDRNHKRTTPKTPIVEAFLLVPGQRQGTACPLPPTVPDSCSEDRQSVAPCLPAGSRQWPAPDRDFECPEMKRFGHRRQKADIRTISLCPCSDRNHKRTTPKTPIVEAFLLVPGQRQGTACPLPPTVPDSCSEDRQSVAPCLPAGSRQWPAPDRDGSCPAFPRLLLSGHRCPCGSFPDVGLS